MSHAWIITGSGTFNFEAPSAADITAGDIIASLSRTARFRGMGLAFYSVAQHSCLVAVLMLLNEGLIPRNNLSQLPAFKPNTWAHHLFQVALLHDGTETYFADLANPLKQILPEYRALEAKVAPLVYERFGVQVTEQDLQRLHLADKQASLIERDYLFPNNKRNWGEMEKLHPGIHFNEVFVAPWQPTFAEQFFSEVFYTFFPETLGHVH